MELASYASGEAQIAAIADDIAYNHHDLDDGLRTGLFGLDDIKDLHLIAKALRKVDAKYSGLTPHQRQFEMLRCLIKDMTGNVIDTATPRLAGMKSVDDLRNAGSQTIDLSASFGQDLKEIRDFLKKNMYWSAGIMKKREQYAVIVERLFHGFAEGGLELPLDWQHRQYNSQYNSQYKSDNGTNNPIAPETLRMREISDYLSGMTDNFATNLYDSMGD